ALLRLGLGHLPLDRDAPSLSTGERQRLRLAQQLEDDLAGLTYVLDEPSVDLHPATRGELQAILRDLVAAGNTVLTVEHDLELVRGADHVVDIGPGPGAAGGRLLYQGPPVGLVGADSPTGRAMATASAPFVATRPAEGPKLWVRGARARNLKAIDVPFLVRAVNVVTGVSGAGKTTLVHHVLAPAVRGDRTLDPGALTGLDGAAGLAVVTLDQRPLGRTPRSNPATYTKLFDVIRAAFARTDEAKARGFDKGRFSFNTEGGRCPTCEGAGVQTVGMHFLGDVTVPCPACDGRRFDDETLAVKWAGLDIAQVLALSVDEARVVFAELPEASRHLDALAAVGLGYVALGQPANTLSGGEAQRVRLAAELARPVSGPALYLLDEPTRGLHPADLPPMQAALRALAEAGHTVVVVEHHPQIWRSADWVVDLGPGGGEDGGRLLYAGPVVGLSAVADSATGAYLTAPPALPAAGATPPAPLDVRLFGVRTHNLQGVDVTFPAGALTVVQGPSGSGKSSLVFDTLTAEAGRRLVGRLSAHVRRLVRRLPAPELDRAQGLTATVALKQRRPAPQPRSTVGTVTEAQDLLRLLFSRVGEPSGLPASAFSFNTERGACPRCTGLGVVLRADPERLITAPQHPLLGGAAAGTRLGAYFTEPDGQHAATLLAAATARRLDLSSPYEALGPEARALVLHGDPEPRAVVWYYKRGKRTGEHHFTAPWAGLLGLVEEEHAKAHLEGGGDAEALMRRLPCDTCGGARLAPGPAAVRVAGRGLGEVNATAVAHLGPWLDALPTAGPARVVADELRPRLDALVDLGLGHLALGRGADTLSAGELQRVHLAAQVGARATQLTFALDEPSRGLHASDVRRLVQVLLRLRDAGNTVVVVDHHPEVARAADHVVCLGPGAGTAGGRVVAEGPATSALSGATPDQPAGRGPVGEGGGQGTGLPVPVRVLDRAAGRRPGSAGTQKARAPTLTITGARAHNLQVDLHIPLTGLTALVGPSGSGKSTLVREVLVPSHRARRPVGCTAFSGLDPDAPLFYLDQGPLPDGELQIPATVLGLFDDLRASFARAPAAKQAKLTKAMFSFRQGNGRCPACKGAGRVVVPLDFLADARGPCEACGSRRYRPEVLACTVDGRSIADVLDLTLAEAPEVLGEHPALTQAVALGLGHVTLGRPASTLSGGEAQRLKLAEVLAARPGATRGGRRARSPDSAVFVLDEPSTGLDPEGVLGVQAVLRALADAGHGVLITTHDLSLVLGADHVIELGPGGGPEGGRVVFAGPPGALSGADTATGRALASQ
ncbi:MAG: hypothetical protein KC933_23695, partial [Myxococcales bacterium]|nr:hypothetical protein [Myxococcales bacterium]